MDEENEVLLAPELEIEQPENDPPIETPELEASEGGELVTDPEQPPEVSEVVEVDYNHKPPENKVMREMREQIRNLNKQLAQTAKAVATETLPPEPQLSDDGIDYDTEKYKEAFLSWHEQKRSHDAKARAQAEAQAAEAESWKAVASKYAEKRATFPIADYPEAEDVVKSALSDAQQSVLVKYAGDPHGLIYGLYKNTPLLAKISEIKDPIEFAIKISELSKNMKVTQSTAPKPDTPLRGGVPTGGGSLEALREKASKSTDYTAYFAAKRKAEEKKK